MNPPRALIIEENRKVMEQLRDSLEVEGFDTEIALSLELGIQILETRKMDLIILDPGPEKPVLTSTFKKLKDMKLKVPIASLVPEKYIKEFRKKMGRKVRFFPMELIDLEPVVDYARKLVEKWNGD